MHAVNGNRSLPGGEVARVDAVHQVAGDVAGDLVANVADRQGDGEPGDRGAPPLPAATAWLPMMPRTTAVMPSPTEVAGV